MGPYTEKQVRQYLAEGRILPSDMARLDKKAEWTTVEHALIVSGVLSKMPKSATKTKVSAGFIPAAVPPARNPGSGPIPRQARVSPVIPMAEPDDSDKTTRLIKPTSPAPAAPGIRPAKSPTPQNKSPKVVKLATSESRISTRRTHEQPPPYRAFLWLFGGFVLLTSLAVGAVGFSFHWDYPSAFKYLQDQAQDLTVLVSGSEKKKTPDITPTPTPSPSPEPAQPDQLTAQPAASPAPVPAPTPEVTPVPSPEPAAPLTTPEVIVPSPSPEPAVPAPSNQDSNPAVPQPTASATLPPIIDTNSPQGYLNRGDAKTAHGDLDGAIADYTQALKLDPKLADAACDRGLARQAQGDLDGAIADYTEALKIKPKFTIAYRNRGLARQAQGDMDGAIADYTHALSLDTKDVQDYYNRGQLKQTKGDLDGALRDLQEYCHLSPPDDFYSHYAHLYIWTISTRQKHIQEADRELTDALGQGWKRSDTDLTRSLAEFLLGKIAEADLVLSIAPLPDAKKDAGQHCEVWYFAGIKRLLLGDQATAIDYFHKCLQTGQKNYCEYLLAQAELKTLGVGSTP